MSDIRTVLRDLGSIFIMLGFLVLITLIVPIYYNEWWLYSSVGGVVPLLLTSSLFFALGMPLRFFFKNARRADYKSAMVTAALSWLTMSLICSIPLMLLPIDAVGTKMDFLSAFFESMSGWTGTGLTMIAHPSECSHTLQFWRTIIQWIGGVGVIVLTLSILARPGTGSYVLYNGEARDQRTQPSILKTAQDIWWIYILYTIIGIVLLSLAGAIAYGGDYISPWEALNHAMTAIATGGFSITDDSLVGYGVVSQIIIVGLMLLGAIAFVAHYSLLKEHKIKKFFEDVQLKAMIAILVVGSAALTLFLLKYYGGNLIESFGAAGFQFTSALTCTGFATDNIPTWSESSKFILAIAMVIGGAAGSTAGGIKLYRAVLLFKGIDWRIKRSLSTPRRVFVHKLGKRPLSQHEAYDLINEASTISFIWIIILGLSILVISYIYPDASLGTVIFEACSAQGNVGLSAGLTSIGMDPVAKSMLILNMWIGRLEIIPIIVLFRSLLGVRANLI